MEKILKTTTVFQGKVVTVDQVEIDFQNGRTSTFEMVKFNVETGVSALAIDDKENVVLVEHFQLGVGQRMLTLPTGGLNKGEDPKARMQLELEEEIGMKANTLTYMFSSHAIPGYIGSKPFYMFLAKDLIPSQKEGDEIEDLIIHKIPINTIDQMIKSGKIIDSRIIIGTLFYLRYLK